LYVKLSPIPPLVPPPQEPLNSHQIYQLLKNIYDARTQPVTDWQSPGGLFNQLNLLIEGVNGNPSISQTLFLGPGSPDETFLSYDADNNTEVPRSDYTLSTGLSEMKDQFTRYYDCYAGLGGTSFAQAQVLGDATEKNLNLLNQILYNLTLS
jgi:hypothetical protein